MRLLAGGVLASAAKETRLRNMAGSKRGGKDTKKLVDTVDSPKLAEATTRLAVLRETEEQKLRRKNMEMRAKLGLNVLAKIKKSIKKQRKAAGVLKSTDEAVERKENQAPVRMQKGEENDKREIEERRRQRPTEDLQGQSLEAATTMPDPLESIEIASYRTEGETSEEDEDEEVPAWVRQENLRRGLIDQQRMDPDELFQETDKSCSLEQIFQGPAENSNRDMKRRGSTGCWQADSLTWQEENAYKANMGHFPGYTVE